VKEISPTAGTREAWLTRAGIRIVDKFRPEFEQHFGEDGISHLGNVHVSTGFPSRGGLTKVIGECWKSKAAEDEVTHHVFINPRLTDIVEVVATLAHELIHAADDGEHKHKGPFLRCARDLGLEGKATATFAGAAFAEFARGLEKEIGAYPHVGLVPVMEKKTQTTRMIKLEAACCGYVVRAARKWLDEGMPSCPCGNPFEEA
jgi:hypothetical protein